MPYKLGMKIYVNDNIAEGTVQQTETVGNSEVMHAYMNPKDFDKLIELINENLIHKPKKELDTLIEQWNKTVQPAVEACERSEQITQDMNLRID